MGGDTSPYVDLPWADSAVGRAVELLCGTDLVWENVVVIGWSEGEPSWAGTQRERLVSHIREEVAFLVGSSRGERLVTGVAGEGPARFFDPGPPVAGISRRFAPV